MFRRPPPDLDRMTSLRVGNLPFKAEVEDLRTLFDKYGDVGDVFLPTERETGRSRGFAFVRYYDKRDAERCRKVRGKQEKCAKVVLRTLLCSVVMDR